MNWICLLKGGMGNERGYSPLADCVSNLPQHATSGRNASSVLKKEFTW